MAERLDPRVRAYLAAIRRATRGVPRARRHELLDDLRTDIVVRLAEHPGATGEDIDDLLRQIGSPRDIAAAAVANAELPQRSAPMALRDVVTVILLLVGGIVVPVAGWLVGVVLLWTSSAWRLRDKVLGTLLVPGGLLVPAVLISGVGSTTSLVSTCSSSQPTGRTACVTVSQPDSTPYLAIAILAVCVGGSIFTACWLTYQARRSARLDRLVGAMPGVAV